MREMAQCGAWTREQEWNRGWRGQSSFIQPNASERSVYLSAAARTRALFCLPLRSAESQEGPSGQWKEESGLIYGAATMCRHRGGHFIRFHQCSQATTEAARARWETEAWELSLVVFSCLLELSDLGFSQGRRGEGVTSSGVSGELVIRTLSENIRRGADNLLRAGTVHRLNSTHDVMISSRNASESWLCLSRALWHLL